MSVLIHLTFIESRRARSLKLEGYVVFPDILEHLLQARGCLQWSASPGNQNSSNLSKGMVQ